MNLKEILEPCDGDVKVAIYEDGVRLPVALFHCGIKHVMGHVSKAVPDYAVREVERITIGSTRGESSDEPTLMVYLKRKKQTVSR